MIPSVSQPEWLVLLAALPVVAAAWLWRWRRGAVAFSSIGEVAELRSSWRVWLGWLPGALRVAALIFLIIALARPQRLLGQTRISTEGIAIMMVIDRSASMTAPMDYSGERLTRLEVVKRVFRDFVEGSDALDGRRGDMVGLVAFAGFADTICPLVRSHDPLVTLAMNTDPAPPREPEGGTAIGDALALAVARLSKAEEDIERINAKGDGPPEFTIKSKVVVLLTDGENNRGRIMPDEAADMAAERGIKVYTIGIGGSGGITYIPGPREGSRIPIRDWVDEDTLKSVANKTGGRYWNARNADALTTIYKQLDELEKSEISTYELQEREEEFEGWAVAGAGLLLLELLLGSTILRRLP